jgi:kynurenine formamidase
MLLDLSLSIDRTAQNADDSPLRKLGHLGTHFDVMEKEFPLEYLKRRGRLLDVSAIRGREVEVEDLKSPIEPGDFVIFRTNYATEIGYGSLAYNRASAELSDATVTYLLEKGISLIGVDAASIQPPAKHLAVDMRCAASNVFVVENLCNLQRLHELTADRAFTIYCAPLNLRGLTGLPCRVVAEVAEPVATSA